MTNTVQPVIGVDNIYFIIQYIITSFPASRVTGKFPTLTSLNGLSVETGNVTVGMVFAGTGFAPTVARSDHRHYTRTIFVSPGATPLASGDTWTRLSAGLPQENAYLGVLREAMAVDQGDPAAVYFGTSNGQLYAGADEGETWQLISEFLPPIWSVEAVTLD